MINVNRPDIHGFTDSYIDGRIRARTVDGDIVTFNITDKGLEASMQDQKLTVPVEISNVTDPIKLMHILKVYTLKASDGQLKIAPIARTVDGNIVTFNITDKETEVMINGQKLTSPAELRNANNLKDLLNVLSKNALKVEYNIRLIPVERKTKDNNLRAAPENCAAQGCGAQACAADANSAATRDMDPAQLAMACPTNTCAANAGLCSGFGCGANACGVAGCGAQACPLNTGAVAGCGAAKMKADFAAAKAAAFEANCAAKKVGTIQDQKSGHVIQIPVLYMVMKIICVGPMHVL